MTTLEKIKAEIDTRFKEERIQNTRFYYDVLEIIDKYAEQDQETTVSVLPDKNGYYPNVCGMCANAESELCDWCGDNKNFRKSGTRMERVDKK